MNNPNNLLETIDRWIGRRTKAQHVLLVTLFLVFFSALAILSSINKHITADEPYHLASGIYYITYWRRDIGVEQPPLSQMIAAAPTLFFNINLPDRKPNTEANTYGFDLLQKNVEVASKIVFISRLMIIGVGVLLGLTIFLFVKKLFGYFPAYIALLFYCLDPNIIAHSSVITTDITFAFVSTATLFFLWIHLNNQKMWSLVLCGLSLGLALSTKHPALFLFPLVFMIILFFASTNRAKKVLSTFTNSFVSYFTICVIAILVLSAVYGFVGMRLGFLPIGKSFSIPMIAPSPYFDSFHYAYNHARTGHWGFLAGDHYLGESRLHYYVIAFLIKTPIPTLIFLSIGILSLFLKFDKRVQKKSRSGVINQKHLRVTVFLTLPILTFFLVFTFGGNMNLGIRYLLPLYPFIFVLVGASIALTFVRKYYTIFLGILLWFVLTSLWVFPSYIAYFNEFVGGPNDGYKYLIDSNIDWGQDYDNLITYLDAKNISQVRLKYFGEIYDVSTREFLYVGCEPTTGIIAISVNYLQGLTELKPHEDTCFAWLRAHNPIHKIGYSIFIYNITEST